MPPQNGNMAELKAATIKTSLAAYSLKIRRILMFTDTVMDDIHGICRFQNTKPVTQNDYGI